MFFFSELEIIMTFFSSNTLERSLETFKGSVQLTKKNWKIKKN